MKRFIFLFLILPLAFSVAYANSGDKKGKAVEEEAVKSTITFMSVDVEYEARFKAVWNEFMMQNPNINVEIYLLNDDEYAATLPAKIAAGSVEDIFEGGFGFTPNPTKDSYQQFLNIEDIYEYWDLLPGGKEGWLLNSKAELGQDVDGIYGVQFEMPYFWAWVYHKDLADEAGAGDKYSVKTMDDLWNWLGTLKAYADAEGLIAEQAAADGAQVRNGGLSSFKLTLRHLMFSRMCIRVKENSQMADLRHITTCIRNSSMAVMSLMSGGRETGKWIWKRS